MTTSAARIVERPPAGLAEPGEGGTAPLSPASTACAQAVAACDAAIAYCVQAGGRMVDARHLRRLVDGVELGQTAADLEARGSPLAQRLWPVCAELAKCVEESCEEHGGDEVLTACADACRKAYDALNTQSSPRVG